jgi:hypothetical protein
VGDLGSLAGGAFVELSNVEILRVGVSGYEFGEVLSALNSYREFGEGSYSDR